MIKNEYNFLLTRQDHKKVMEFLQSKYDVTGLKMQDQTLQFFDTPDTQLAKDGVVLYTERKAGEETTQRFEGLNMFSDAPQNFTYSLSKLAKNQRIDVEELLEVYPNLEEGTSAITQLFTAEVSSVKQKVLVDDRDDIHPAIIEVSHNTAQFQPVHDAMNAGEKTFYKWMSVKRISGSNGQKGSTDILKRVVSEITERFAIHPETESSLSSAGLARYQEHKNRTKPCCNLKLNVS